eukprot:11047530-Ditylum_brightwellii.AAC.1
MRRFQRFQWWGDSSAFVVVDTAPLPAQLLDGVIAVLSVVPPGVFAAALAAIFATALAGAEGGGTITDICLRGATGATAAIVWIVGIV